MNSTTTVFTTYEGNANQDACMYMWYSVSSFAAGAPPPQPQPSSQKHPAQAAAQDHASELVYITNAL